MLFELTTLNMKIGEEICEFEGLIFFKILTVDGIFSQFLAYCLPNFFLFRMLDRHLMHFMS